MEAGALVAVTGLTQTWAGQSLGAEPEGKTTALEPVMTYRVRLPAGADPAVTTVEAAEVAAAFKPSTSPGNPYDPGII